MVLILRKLPRVVESVQVAARNGFLKMHRDAGSAPSAWYRNTNPPAALGLKHLGTILATTIHLLHLGCSRGNVELGDALDFDRVARPAALRFVVRHLLHIRCHDSTVVRLFHAAPRSHALVGLELLLLREQGEESALRGRCEESYEPQDEASEV
eukprot:CAMPEP_0178995130 /NCGR_PEP_ID=MMETSP0795-20121207/7670_1 /TAXON_ID=88552 /ORGANISM="Amoebophrya sp., Strain Ameob2" /LENGTH=153 /DNA_ID=CAMNT_0020687431 /DNA_START=546 /DNA_END=1003 /DNA_ORIENTATION=-